MKAIRNYNIYLIAVALLMLCAVPFVKLHAQGRKAPIYFGNLKSTKKVGEIDTLFIQYIPPMFTTGMVSEKVHPVTDKSGNFRFTLPKHNVPTMMIVSVRYNGKKRRINDGFLVQPGDSAQMDITYNGNGYVAKFKGKGAEKNNVVNMLNTLVDNFEEAKTQIGLHIPDSLESKLAKAKELTRLFEKQKRELINNSKLDIDTKKILTYSYANIFYHWARLLHARYTMNYKDNEELKTLIRSSFNENRKEFNYAFDPLMINSFYYINFQGIMEAYDVSFNTKSAKAKPVRYYDAIKHNYTGILRERLIANYMIGKTGLLLDFEVSSQAFDSLRLDGEQFMTIPSIRKAYSDKIRLAKGKPIFKASFIDREGNAVATESWKGKVVLLDIWGVGCSWCAHFHNLFHKNVYPLFKDNKDFLYVSINAGDDKKGWEKGMSSGLYTSFEYQNLSVGKEGFNHPFITYYDIQSLPFAIILDKDGNIHTNTFNADEGLISELKALLAQP